jgi:mycothiol synthase
MDNRSVEPTPPAWAELTWRPVSRDDLAVIGELAGECYRADGGLAFLFAPQSLAERYFPDDATVGLGAFTADGHLVACTVVYLARQAEVERAVIVGQVRPDYRHRGLGAYLMRWSETQASALFTPGPSDQRLLRVATESLTDSAHRLYEAFGFERTFDEWVMRRDLHRPLPDRPFPPGVAVTTWQPEVAERFYQAYHSAFRERPGSPNWNAAVWISNVTENDLVPEWTLLATAGDEPLGFVVGNIDLTASPPGGYVWQIGVVPTGRRRGLASALLAEMMRRMQAAGAPWVDLTVHLNNPGAIEAYARLGFVTAGRRARYERPAEP